MKDKEIFDCKHCGGLISKHDIKKHERKCYLNPVNSEKIYLYLIQGLFNLDVIEKKVFKNWCLKNDILTPVSLMNRFREKFSLKERIYYKYSLILLMLELYEKYEVNGKGKLLHIDLEILDQLIGKLTFGSFTVAYEDYLRIVKESHKRDEIDTVPNYLALITHVKLRAVQDWISASYDESRSLIDKLAAREFLRDFDPALYTKVLRNEEKLKNQVLDLDTIQLQSSASQIIGEE